MVTRDMARELIIVLKSANTETAFHMTALPAWDAKESGVRLKLFTAEWKLKSAREKRNREKLLPARILREHL